LTSQIQRQYAARRLTRDSCCFPIVFLPAAPATSSATVADKGRFEVTRAGIRTLDYYNAILTGTAGGQKKRLRSAQNAATRSASAARCGHHATSVLRCSPLAASSAKSCFQDRSPCAEIRPRRCSGISAGTLHLSGSARASAYLNVPLDRPFGDWVLSVK